MLQILATKRSSAKKNMDMDAMLLKSLGKSLDPILRFYDWENPQAFTYGYFTKVKNHLDLERIQEMEIDLAKRPTGGGIVYHGSDLAFAFLLPSSNPNFSSDPLENYKFVNRIILETLLEFFGEDFTSFHTGKKASQGVDFCMAKPTKYDIVLDGKKVAGAAQRKTRTGYLHQGTISLARPQEEFLSRILLSKKDIRDAILRSSYAPLQDNWTQKDLNDLRYKLRLLLIQHFRSALDNPFE